MAGWIGCDLDGTLAFYDTWSDGEIGAPIPAMVDRVKAWLSIGQEVRIMTARVGICEGENADGQAATALFASQQERLIKAWCLRHLGKILPVTASKDFEMIELYDDRCRQVIKNTGEVVGVRCENG